MESPTADPDTQAEVNLMILDYLLCMAIHQVLDSGNGKFEDDTSWSLDTINSMDISMRPIEDQRRSPFTRSGRSNPQPYQPHESDKLPAHATRVVAFDRSYNALVRFVTLCGTARDNLPDGHADIAANLITQAALNEYHTAGVKAPGRYRECIERVTACLREALDPYAEQVNLAYLSTLLPSIDLASAESEGPGRKSPRGDTITRSVLCFLTDLMKTLDPPILIQLERGKLGGLSREETQQLKDRIGL
ncbi:hypothetical protein RIB2604_02504310 [Aspergillus luchuensis]|uniref:Uncharacterized protein n=1 Tax=Aspergillus kawachii TaxID=1069201 RepID=A0A146FTC3_ASPKA|nr:hypothetical protein RIB2604_02504310 [Aspergillus luchuensis]